ncbi:MAG TPA: bifunctional 3-(3-hydroxy-phenyl)propionate/3-hydroxycinnamic acid hydroxylase [Acidimicrobiales bacterium]|nr:bifunctional 3-(3-hydroxy-phenyl)propionate/3-hydroxycinnamic acid hydroxylase [Acidimicrobiales bacterium]
MVPAEVDVAIVGFGPTGATLANACGRLGLRTLVYERSHAPYPLPRACHLDAEIARVFQDLGFEPELASLVTPSAGMEYVGPGATHLFSFEGFEREQLLGWPEDLVFIQPDIDRMLRRGVDRYPTVEVHLGAAAPPVTAVPARFVVACDGAGSDVRRELGVPQRDLGFDEEWLVVDVMLRRPVPLPRIIQQVCDPARLATFVPSHGPHRRWELRINEGDDPGDLARPERVWSLLAPWGVGPDDAELVRAVPYRFHAVVAERWRAGRVFLAGDAAHQMPPFMGQGLCSGVRDAVNLAWKLAAVVRGEAGQALLDTYETERRPHAEAVIELSIQAGRLLGQLAAALAAGRPLPLPEPSVPDPTRWSRLPGLNLGGRFPIGHLVPQPWVSGRRLDELLGDGWAVVARVEVPTPAGVPLVLCPNATYGHEAVLVRPDRYIAGVADPEGFTALPLPR